jgi:hypothetical protein
MRPTNRRFTTNNPNPSAGAAADDAEKTSAEKTLEASTLGGKDSISKSSFALELVVRGFQQAPKN